MSRRITKKQKAFADEYLETGNGLRSALKVYNTTKPDTAKVIASENLTKPNVLEYLQGIAYSVANHMETLAFKAKSENVQQLASKDILDRSGYKATDKLQLSGNFTLEDLFKKSKANELKVTNELKGINRIDDIEVKANTELIETSVKALPATVTPIIANTDDDAELETQ